MFVNSLLFLYLFLPVTLFMAYITNEKIKNIILLIASFIFYAWGGVSYLSVLIASTLLNWLVGLAIDKCSGAPARKRWLITGIILNLLPLLIFKYTGFFKDNIDILTGLFGIKPIVMKAILLPLGISFYSFKAISYLITVHRRETPAQRNYCDLALYISFFPTVLAGPIDRYRNFAPQLYGRKPDATQFASGIRRFAIGLGKKVLIANSLSLVAEDMFSNPVSTLSTPLAWLGLICYSLQIYYDFSGYTDMALGVGKMFGFELMENFNFPYISRSIKEFWQRWHISLSSWLRDYLFLPLAYSTSRKLKKERYLNLRVDHVIYMIATSVTFLVCGFWHGAAWNFIIWGLIHGFLLINEQLWLGRMLRKTYKPIGHLYTLFFLMISWVFFRTATIHDANQYIGLLFGSGGKAADWKLILDYFNTGFILTMLIAVLGTTRFFSILVEMAGKAADNSLKPVGILVAGVYETVSILVVMFILAVATVFMVAGTNNPFIYFKF